MKTKDLYYFAAIILLLVGIVLLVSYGSYCLYHLVWMWQVGVGAGCIFLGFMFAVALMHREGEEANKYYE